MRKVLQIAKVQLIMRATSQMWCFVVFTQPVLYLIMTMLMMKESTRAAYGMAAVLGAGMMGSWSSILFSSGSDIDRERKWGTLETVVGCPTPLYSIVMGKALANSFAGLFSMVLAYVTALLLFGQKLTIVHPLWFAAALLLTIISVAALGMIVCTVFTLSRAARGLMNVMENPVFLLCGIMFPIAILPLWTRPLSYILSLTWGMEALRMTSLGITDWSRFLLYMGLLVVQTAAYMLISVWLFGIVENKARKEATLGVY